MNQQSKQCPYFFIFIFSFLPSDWLGLITFITTEQNECRRVCADYTPRVRTLLNVQGGVFSRHIRKCSPLFYGESLFLH